MSPPYIPGSDEEWADVTRAPGRLWVSTHGRVWSRKGLVRPSISPHVNTTLKNGEWVARSGGGYVMVHVPHTEKSCGVHILVAEAFLGPRPAKPKHLVCHRDDDKLNNRLANLYWGTHADNARDAARNLQRKRAELPWMTTASLLRAGWTNTTISRLLPPPILAPMDPAADRCYDRYTRLWHRDEVAAATPALHAWREQKPPAMRAWHQSLRERREQRAS